VIQDAQLPDGAIEDTYQDGSLRSGAAGGAEA